METKQAAIVALATDIMTGISETQTQKRVVKLSAKALAAKLDTLKANRKAKLNQAASVRKSMQTSMQNNDKVQVENALKELIEAGAD